ncbi:MAG: molybdenum cofactor guanylyltransferase MobA [Rhodospirillaceae bacterium]|nr:molybdenum cofactor guanylyltransferase MobA [Rhodospirillaceae bacterium]
MIEPMKSSISDNVIGVILAGGQSRRFGGGDKFIRELKGEPLVDRVIERVRPQTSQMIISSNAETPHLTKFRLPIVADVIEGQAGPLAGILSGMEWTRENASDCDWIVSFPTDAPFVPLDLVAQMHEQAVADDAEIVCAASGGRTHPVCALWRVNLAGNLRQVMEEEEMRKIDLWTARHRLSVLEFSDQPYDPFFNINRPEDLEQAETILAGLSG